MPYSSVGIGLVTSRPVATTKQVSNTFYLYDLSIAENTSDSLNPFNTGSYFYYEFWMLLDDSIDITKDLQGSED